jgi:glutamine cyclotransferase
VGVEIVAQFHIPMGAGRPVGLEWDGTHLWLACFGAGIGEKSELYRLNAVTLQADLFHRLPVYWVEDLAWDGHLLWSCDWIFGLGFAIDPATGDTLHTYRPPGRNPVGQAWDGQYLWVSDTEKDSLWALDISAAHVSSVRATSWSQMKSRYRGR